MSTDKSKSENARVSSSPTSMLCYRPVRLADNDELHAIAQKHYGETVLIHPADYAIFVTREPSIAWCVEARQAGRCELVGYFTVVPLKSVDFENLMGGNIGEKDISAQLIANYDEAQSLYILEVTAASGRGSQVLLAFREVLRHLLIQYPNIQKVGAWAYSDSGGRLARLFKFNRSGVAQRQDYYEAPATDLIASLGHGGTLGYQAPRICQ